MNKVVTKRAIAYLTKNKRGNTRQIKDYVNKTTLMGTTMSELGNVLGNNPLFVCVGTETFEHWRKDMGNYQVKIWELVQK